MKKFCCGLLFLSLIVLVSACGTVAPTRSSSSNSITSDSLSHSSFQPSSQPTATPTSMPMLSIPSQMTTPSPTPTPRITPTSPPEATPTPPPASSCITFSNDATLTPPKNGGLDAPYGPAPVTTEAQQLTAELFQPGQP